MTDDLRHVFLWPLAAQAPEQPKLALFKPDRLLEAVEDLIERRRAWAPISGGTRRTEPESKLETWLEQQNHHCLSVQAIKPAPGAPPLRLEDFPSEPGETTRTITTSRRIVYLIDSFQDFRRAYASAFGSSASLEAVCNADLPVFLYVTNSVQSGGRAFSGDPFTGQVTAYTKIFATDIYNAPTHNAVVYYPHQLYSQVFHSSGQRRDTKGLKVLARLATCLIFHSGIIVNPRTWEVLP